MKKDQRLLQDATDFGMAHGAAQAFTFCALFSEKIIDKLPDGDTKDACRTIVKRFREERDRAISRIRGDAK